MEDAEQSGSDFAGLDFLFLCFGLFRKDFGVPLRLRFFARGFSKYPATLRNIMGMKYLWQRA